jgi:hypothetical protein
MDLPELQALSLQRGFLALTLDWRQSPVVSTRVPAANWTILLSRQWWPGARGLIAVASGSYQEEGVRWLEWKDELQW